MFSTSSDLLRIVAAVCLVWLTIFVSWFLWPMGRMLRDLTKTINLLKDLLERLSQVTHLLQDRLEHIGSGIKVLAELATSLASHFIKENKDQNQDKN